MGETRHLPKPRQGPGKLVGGRSRCPVTVLPTPKQPCVAFLGGRFRPHRRAHDLVHLHRDLRTAFNPVDVSSKPGFTHEGLWSSAWGSFGDIRLDDGLLKPEKYETSAQTAALF